MISKIRNRIFAILSIIFVFAVVGAFGVLMPQKSSAETGSVLSVWDGGTDVTWYNTTDNEFTITTAEQLAGFAAIVNGTATDSAGATIKDSFSGKTIKLGADIDLNGRAAGETEWVFSNADYTADGYAEANVTLNTNHLWTPIGKNYNDGIEFSGTIDGQGHTIYRMAAVSNKLGVGFIGGPHGGNGYTVKNIIFDDCVSMSRATGEDLAGIVAGYSEYYQSEYLPTIDNVTVQNSIVRGDQAVGVFCGQITSNNIKNCVSKNNTVYANATNTAKYVGGFFGRITDSNGYAVFEQNMVLGLMLVLPENKSLYGLFGGFSGRCTFDNCKSDSFEAVTSDDCIANLTNNNYLVGLSEVVIDGQDKTSDVIFDENGVIQFYSVNNTPSVNIQFFSAVTIESFKVNGEDSDKYTLSSDGLTLSIAGLEDKANNITFSVMMNGNLLNFKLATGFAEMPELVKTIDGKSFENAQNFLINKDGINYFEDVEASDENIFTIGFETPLDVNAKAVIKYNGNSFILTGNEVANLSKLAGASSYTVEYYYYDILVSSTVFNDVVCLTPLGVDGVYWAKSGEYNWEFVSASESATGFGYYKSAESVKTVKSSTSEFKLYVIGHKIIGYDFAEASEKNYDYLQVFCNGTLEKEYKTDITETTDVSELVWKYDLVKFGNDVFNELKFVYKKDSSGDKFLDQAFIKNLIIVNEFDETGLASAKIQTTKDGITQEFDFSDGDEVEFDFFSENSAKFFVPVLNQGEECYVYVNGEKQDDALFEIEGYYAYNISSIKHKTIVLFEYVRTGYYPKTIGLTLKVSASGNIQDHLIKDGNITVNNTVYKDYPFVFNTYLTEDGKIVYGTTNQGQKSSVSGIVLTTTGSGVLLFDYYISSEQKYDYVVYNETDTIITADNASKQTYLTGDVSTSSGIQGWNTVAIPISAEDGEVKNIHIGYRKDGSGERGDDTFAIANISYLSGSFEVSYGISNAEGGTVSLKKTSGEDVTEGESIPVATNLTLSATVNDGFEFYGWKNLTTGELFLDKDLTIVVVGNAEYQAIIEPVETFLLRGENNFFETFEDAFASSCKTFIVLKNANIIQNVIVPVGKTLIIPYSTIDTTGYKQNNSTSARVSWNSSIKPFRTLTINNGVTFTVNGSLIVGGVQHSTDQNAQGHTSGDYAQLVNNGNIILNGNMDVRGLVTGSGTLTVNSGAELKQPFMVNNYSGGSNTSALYGANQFPFVQFATVNVQCKQIINYGAKVIGSTSLYFWSSITTQDVNLIGAKGSSTDGTLIWMEEGSRLEITYTNKTVNEKVGNIHLGDSGVCTISVYGKITAGEFYLQGYGSADMVLAIPYTYNFVLKSGATVTMAHKYKIMPGAVVTIENGATLNIVAGGGLYVYDGLIQADKSNKLYPDASVLGKYEFAKSGMFIVNGTLNINGEFAGIAQTTGNTGVINVDSGATVGKQTITDGCSGGYTDNETKFEMSGRIYGLYGFVNLEAGKTYKAFADKAFTLETFTVVSAARIDESKWTVTLNQSMSGRFLEFDGENYVATVKFSVPGVDEGTIIVINGVNYTVQNGEIEAALQFALGGNFGYYTFTFETAEATHNSAIALDAATVLDKVVVSVVLDETNNKYEINEGETFVLNAIVTYNGGSTEKIQLTADSFTTYVKKDAKLTSTKLTDSFTKDLYIIRTALANYIASVKELSSKSGNELLDAAKACYKAYGTLTNGLNVTDLAYVNGKIGDLQNYAGEITTAVSVVNASAIIYGDGAKTVEVTLTFINGSTDTLKAEIFVTGFGLGNNVITATVKYTGTYAGNEYTLETTANGVTPYGLTVTWGKEETFTYDGTAQNPSASVVALGSDKVTVTVGGAAINAGKHTATATLSGDDAKYYRITDGETKEFEILAKSATVTVVEKTGVTTDNKTIVFNATSVDLVDTITFSYKIWSNSMLVATVAANGTITFEDDAFKTSDNSLMPGTYKVTAFAENSNYNFMFNETTFKVNASDKYYTVTFTDGGSRVFDGSEFIPAVTAKVTGTDTSETEIVIIITFNGETVAKVRNAGTYEIIVKVGSGERERTYTLTYNVVAKEIEIEWNTSLTFNGEAQKPEAKVKDGELCGSDIVTVNVSSEGDFVNVGTYTATATLGGANAGNYTIKNTFGTTSFTINPAPIKLKINDATSVYGNNVAEITLGIKDGQLFGNDTLSDIAEIVFSVTSASSVGTYEITGNGINKNYAITFETGHYSVTKRAITVTIDDKTSVYGEALAELTANVTSGSIVNGDENVYTLKAITAKNVGEYVITTDADKDNANYAITVTNGIYTITKRAITVSVEDKSSVYGNDLEALTSTLKDGTIVEGDSLAAIVKLSKEAGENAGKYAITAECVNGNYAVKFVYTMGDYSVYTIEKRAITLTITDSEFEYTDAIANMKLAIGLKDGYTLKAGETLDVLNLTYTIKQNGTELTEKTLRGGEWTFRAFYDNANYTVTFENADDETKDYGILSITKPLIEIADLGARYTYSGEAFPYYNYETAITVKANSTADDFGCELYFNGQKVEEILNAGTYTVRVILKSSIAFALKDGDGKNYKDFTVIVDKKDITDTIKFVCEGSVETENGIYVPLGNYTQIGNSLDGTEIGFKKTLTFGCEVSELDKFGLYLFKVTVDDDNYTGEKEFTLNVVASIDVKSANLKKYTEDYKANKTSANADKVRDLLGKLTETDLILFTHENHAAILAEAKTIEGAHVNFLKDSLTETLDAFNENGSYANILTARAIVLDLKAFKPGEGAEEIAAYESAWATYYENLNAEAKAAGGISDFLAVVTLLTAAAAATMAAAKKFVL